MKNPFPTKLLSVCCLLIYQIHDMMNTFNGPLILLWWYFTVHHFHKQQDSISMHSDINVTVMGNLMQNRWVMSERELRNWNELWKIRSPRDILLHLQLTNTETFSSVFIQVQQTWTRTTTWWANLRQLKAMNHGWVREWIRVLCMHIFSCTCS